MFGVLTELRRYAARGVPPTAVGACDRRPPFENGLEIRALNRSRGLSLKTALFEPICNENVQMTHATSLSPL